MPDVVYHENGHNFHYLSMIATGAIQSINDFFNSEEIRGLSEGLADTLSTMMTHDAAIGPGFFFGNPEGLRNLDPVGIEKRYPDDITGIPHDAGEIIGGAIWDARKALVISLGEAKGHIAADRLFNGILAHSTTFLATYMDALAADDDDGNLANGTPNQCDISKAFIPHGLATAPEGGVTIGTPSTDATSFLVPITVPPGDCPGRTVTGVDVRWQVRGEAGRAGTVPLTANGATWAGPLPVDVVDAVLQYQVDVRFDDGSMTTRSLNAADPYYEAYVGAVTTIACHDFETDHGWTHAAVTGTDEWFRGAGGSAPAAGDPDSPVSGATIFGTDLIDNGLYEATSDSYAESPAIDVTGFTNVRLHYKRWLDVDDGQFDRASIVVGGTPLWQNATDALTPVAHRDREWRFHDVDLTAQAASGMLAVRYQLTSDDTAQSGGWNIDDFCIVGRAPTCGDTILRDPEQCDDGNTEPGDGCDATCVIEPPGEEGGCCSTGSDPRGALVIGGLALFGLLRRRRRPTS
jgi:MYXO-CTERM domain-containing protein